MYSKSANAFVWTFVAIAFCIILLEGVVIVVGSNVAMGQQQSQLVNNQIASSSSILNQQEQQQLLQGISFKIDNVTFTHHMASVNGIQLTML